MSELIQRAIDQTERAKYGVCCEEAVHALDVANDRVNKLQAEVADADRAYAALQVELDQALARTEADEATLRAIEGLPRYRAVLTEHLGLPVLREDDTGPFVKRDELEAKLKEARDE